VHKEIKLKYQDSVEQSAEYLRLALQFMTKQATALHPVSYAVWYEYVSGRNAALKSTIDELTRNGSLLDEEATSNIFQTYIAEVDEELAKRVSEGFQKIMADMSASATQAGDQADKFGIELKRWTESLGNDAPKIAMGIDTLLLQTHSMQGAISDLKGRLDESRREIDELRKEVSKAREESLSDALTGLANRRAFDLALASALTEPEPATEGPSLLIADIDFFKRVNDTYGHLFGDKVIRTVAEVLKRNVKGMDTAARYGGEEFVVLLPDTPLHGARKLAERIRMIVEQCRIKRTDRNEVVANLTISFGVATYKAGESAGEFIARADSALYRSKFQGRNRVTMAT
jgi:diguanylate cyclase